MTNIEQAEKYIAKQKLLGQEKFILKYDFLRDSVKISQNFKYNWTEQDKDIVIPSFVTHIADSGFKNNKVIETITFQNPDNIKYIGAFAFSQCLILRNIILPEKLATLQAGTFANCRALKCIEIPNKISVIGNYAFFQCITLKQIKIDKNKSELKKIGEIVFEHCYQLEKRHDLYRVVEKNNQ